LIAHVPIVVSDDREKAKGLAQGTPSIQHDPLLSSYV
jgi:hypothetical protein